MVRGLIHYRQGSKYHAYGLKYHVQRGQTTMGKGSDIPWVRRSIYHTQGVKIPWVGVQNTMGSGVKIPWIVVTLPWVRGQNTIYIYKCICIYIVCVRFWISMQYTQWLPIQSAYQDRQTPLSRGTEHFYWFVPRPQGSLYILILPSIPVTIIQHDFERMLFYSLKNCFH